MANSTHRSPPNVSSFNLGGGLIEIAALTALIGSTTAESLVLGNKGAAGLVWGTMSVFGTLTIIRACISAATPDWLRDTLGVRAKEIDAAVGLALRLDQKDRRGRARVGSAVGLACKVETTMHGNTESDGQPDEVSRQDVYAFDAQTAGNLEMIPENLPKEPFQAYTLAQDPHSKERRVTNAWKDWIGILASISKLVELTVMWKHNAVLLCLTSGIYWMVFFLAAMVLQICGLSREYPKTDRTCEVDYLAGQLPTPLRVGGRHKILLGAPENVRQSSLWRISWAIGSVASISAVIATYMTLGRQNARVFAIWTGFQFFWLAMRSIFYHFAEGKESILQYPASLGKDWKSIPMHFKARIRRLVFALSEYQINLHPRGVYSYEEDTKSLDRIENVQAVFTLTPDEAARGNVDLSVVAVVGDTLLSSAAWILESKFTGLQLYDTCIIILDVRGVSVAIPCARVLSDKPLPESDIEAGSKPQFPQKGVEPRFPPKGGHNRGQDISWWYWIPCGEKMWLQAHSTDMKFLGKRTADVLSDEGVTKKLLSGDLFIGMSEVAHVQAAVQSSRKTCQTLQVLLS